MKDAKDIKIIFMGTPDFAVGVLRSLVESSYNVVGVVTVPDKPAGRGRQLRASAVKEFTVQHNESLGEGSSKLIKLMQPEKLRDEEFHRELEELDADLYIVVAFRMLPEIVWAKPRLGTFNLHASLLPNYRGAAPINWAIINGETKTGVTTFMLNHEIDCGAILAQRECEIAVEDDFETLYNKLMVIGAGLVLETVDSIALGDVKPLSQVESDAIMPAPKLFKESMELVITPVTTAWELYNKIRGLSPYPAAWAVISPADRSVITSKLFVAHVEEDSSADGFVGQWQTDGRSYLRLGAVGGWLYIDELQPQNKKRMSTVDFLRGWR